MVQQKAHFRDTMDLLKQYVGDHDDLDVVDDKITCTLTGHEFGSMERASEKPEHALKMIEAYLGGKKYKMMKENYSQSFDQYDHIVPHKTHPKRLFCTLCAFPLNRIPQEVEEHITGRRHKCRVREQEGGKDDFDIPEGLRDMAMEDDSDHEEEMKEEEQDTGFEVVQQDEEVTPSFANPASSKYDSSSDEEEEVPVPVVSGQKRVTAGRPPANRPRRKKNKRGAK